MGRRSADPSCCSTATTRAQNTFTGRVTLETLDATFDGANAVTW